MQEQDQDPPDENSPKAPSTYGKSGTFKLQEAGIAPLEPIPEPAKHVNGRRTESQAERIIRKLGGARRLAKTLEILGKGRNPASIYKWTYSRENGGTDGLIPTKALPAIMEAARAEGVLITAEDLDPRAIPISEFKPKRHQD